MHLYAPHSDSRRFSLVMGASFRHWFIFHIMNFFRMNEEPADCFGAKGRFHFIKLLFDHPRTVTLAVLVLLLALQTGFPGNTAAEDITLPESGIRYPGGFDSNTVGEIKGAAFGFSIREKGPVSFRLISAKETYTVLVSPLSAWNAEIRETLREGAEVHVLGSKTLGADGRLYMIAQQIEFPQTGKRISFRSEKGSPLWERTVGKKAGESGSAFSRWLFDGFGRGGGDNSPGNGAAGSGGRGSGSGSGGGGGGGGR
jgi:uncharacterized membrane protein YgcG